MERWRWAGLGRYSDRSPGHSSVVSYGWEAQILREGELVIGRRFDLRRLAEQWAEEERKVLEKGGA